jgi:outer membrane protein OmpA-like peptidoglycan-associated protein
MFTLRTILPIALVALAGACAPMRQPGALSPISSRVTNEVIADDAHAFDMWSHRVSVLAPATDAADPRGYVIARAAAWLAYARDAYASDPRDGASDVALAETRRLVLALEAGTLPDVTTLPAPVDSRARADLWAIADEARLGAPRLSAPVALATAEVALVRASRLAGSDPSNGAASHPMTDVERACEMQAQLTIAERLLTSFRSSPVALAAPAAVVALQGEPAVPLVVPRAPLPMPGPTRHGVERAVHFAVNSSDLALSSRITLGEVIAMLRTHPRANLVIRGFTDPRGGRHLNRDLAVRRTESVRRFLDAATLDLGRVTMEGIGTDSSAAQHASVESFARDRRVTLAFTGADGQPLTVTEFQALDMDHERDLQVETGRSRMRGAHAAAIPRLTPR